MSPGRGRSRCGRGSPSSTGPRSSTSRSPPTPASPTSSTAHRCRSSRTATPPRACGCRTGSSRPARSTTTASRPPARTPRSAASAPRARPTRASPCGSPSSPARSSSPASTPPTPTSPAGRRPRRLPRRLHLRAGVRRPDVAQRAGPQRRLGGRRRGADARRVPPQVLALPHRRAAARGAPAVPAAGDLGRPRGRGQLRRRAPGRRGQEPARAVRRPPRQRLPRLVRAHAARPAPGTSTAACRSARRAVPARHAPVPRRPAVQPERLVRLQPVPAERLRQARPDTARRDPEGVAEGRAGGSQASGS